MIVSYSLLASAWLQSDEIQGQRFPDRKGRFIGRAEIGQLPFQNLAVQPFSLRKTAQHAQHFGQVFGARHRLAGCAQCLLGARIGIAQQRNSRRRASGKAICPAQPAQCRDCISRLRPGLTLQNFDRLQMVPHRFIIRAAIPVQDRGVELDEAEFKALRARAMAGNQPVIQRASGFEPLGILGNQRDVVQDVEILLLGGDLLDLVQRAIANALRLRFRFRLVEHCRHSELAHLRLQRLGAERRAPEVCQLPCISQRLVLPSSLARRITQHFKRAVFQGGYLVLPGGPTDNRLQRGVNLFHLAGPVGNLRQPVGQSWSKRAIAGRNQHLTIGLRGLIELSRQGQLIHGRQTGLINTDRRLCRRLGAPSGDASQYEQKPERARSKPLP